MIERDADALVLSHDHLSGPSWPWRYRCTQRIAVSDEGLSASLTLVNLDSRPMPAGLGFHPYLSANSGDRLSFRCSETWLTDETCLARDAGPPDALADWRSGAEVFRPELIDHCHGGWEGVAELIGPSRTVRLTATGAHFLHVHIPPGQGYVGVEPVTHMPDAVNRPESPPRTGLRVLQPGEELTLAMRIAVV